MPVTSNVDSNVIIEEGERKEGATLYTEQILSVLDKIGVLHIRQLIVYLIKTCNISNTEAIRAVKNNCIDGYILKSANDYVCTMGASQTMFVGEVSVNNTRTLDDIRIKESVTLKKEAAANCACFDAILMCIEKENKSAINFNRSHTVNPFSLSFVDEKSGKIVQIAFFPNDEEYLKNTEIKMSQQPSLSERDNIKRIAVVENPKNSDDVAHIGFTHVCSFNKDGVLIHLEKIGKEYRWEHAPAVS